MFLSTRSRSLRIRAAVLSGALMLTLAPDTSIGPASAGSCGEEPCSAIPVVKKWLEHLEEGESRRAWRLMTKQTRRAIGGFEQFKKESSAWAEGWGAWNSARDRDFELRVIAPMDMDAASVVTITGRVAQEGPFKRSAAALPVITHDGESKVDPVDGKARIEPIRPTWGEKLGRRPRFKAAIKRIRARFNSAYFVVKGANVEPQRAKLKRVGRRSYKAVVNWPRRLSSGPHVVTIASWGRHGFKAVAVRFRVRS